MARKKTEVNVETTESYVEENSIVEPVAETVEPVAETVEPVAETVEPVAETVEPVAETVEPVAIAEEQSAGEKQKTSNAEEIAENPQTEEVSNESQVSFETPSVDPLTLSVTNHGKMYYDTVNKLWIDNGVNFLIFEDESKKQRLINNLVQINILAGYDRFEWVGV